MTREMIIAELLKRGYKAEAMNRVKNGVECEGIGVSVESGPENINVTQVIYVADIISEARREGKSLDEVVSIIINISESYSDTKSYNAQLFEREFLLEHLYIGLQRESNEELIKSGCWGFYGIESYLYVRWEEQEMMASVKLNSEMLERFQISELEAWARAMDNVKEDTFIKPMGMFIAEMVGTEYTDEMEEATENIYVVTNKSKKMGACGILNKEMLLQFAKTQGTNKFIVLPSSIHEMLLVPYDERIEFNKFSQMVGEVNDSYVLPEERLSDMAYMLVL